MTPGPVSDTYQGPDDWGDLRALLASVSAESEPNKTRLRLAREQFRALVNMAEFAEEAVDAIEGHHWPMDRRQEAYSMVQRAARKRGLLDCDVCNGTGLVGLGLPSDGPVPCPECGPEDKPL